MVVPTGLQTEKWQSIMTDCQKENFRMPIVLRTMACLLAIFHSKEFFRSVVVLVFFLFCQDIPHKEKQNDNPDDKCRS